jgi:hypothetical protein
MLSLIIEGFKKWRRAQNFKAAVKLANKTTAKTGRKQMVFLIDGKFQVCDHQKLKALWHLGTFKKGVNYKDIKQHAVYTTMQNN